MNKRRWRSMAVLLLFMAVVLGGCGPASEPRAGRVVHLAEDLTGTVPLGTANRAALADAYDTTVDCTTEEIRISEHANYYARTITRIAALEESPYKEAVWNWIHTAREELAMFSEHMTESATVDLGYLSIRLSVPELREVSSVDTALRTAVFDLETGQQLVLADLFYENVPVAELINRRLLKVVENAELKRPFTGFPANYPYFGLNYKEYDGTTELVLYCDKSHPFWPYHNLRMALACYASPAGNYYYDVTYERLATDGGQECMLPTVTVNDGTLPEVDAAINAAIREMSPRLKQAEMVSHPNLSLEKSRFSIYYLERNRLTRTAAVSGCTYTCDLATGQPVVLREEVPVDGERVYYELSGKADPYIVSEEYEEPMAAYTPPDGSALSDFVYHYGSYYATLTEPSGRRILVEFRTPSGRY